MKEMIQHFAPALTVCFFVTAIMVATIALSCFLTDISSTKKGMTLAYICAISTPQFLIGCIIVNKAPDYVIYLLPSFVFTCALKMALVCTSEDSYSIDEIAIFIIACVFNWTINCPHLVRINTTSFTLGCVCCVLKVYYTYETFPILLILCLTGALFQYNFG